MSNQKRKELAMSRAHERARANLEKQLDPAWGQIVAEEYQAAAARAAERYDRLLAFRKQRHETN